MVRLLKKKYGEAKTFIDALCVWPGLCIFDQLPQPATGTEDRATTKDGEESGRDQEFYSQIWLKLAATSECHFHQLQRDISVEVFAADLDLGCSNCSI